MQCHHAGIIPNQQQSNCSDVLMSRVCVCIHQVKPMLSTNMHRVQSFAGILQMQLAPMECYA